MEADSLKGQVLETDALKGQAVMAQALKGQALEADTLKGHAVWGLWLTSILGVSLEYPRSILSYEYPRRS